MSFVARFILFPLFIAAYALKLTGLRGYVLLGYTLGDVLHAFGFRRAIVLENLALAYGSSLGDAEKKALVRGIYRNVGMVFVGILRNFSLSPADARREVHFSAADQERLRGILARGKGVVFLSAHISNWELSAIATNAYGFPTVPVVKKMTSRLSQAMIEVIRRRTGVDVIYSGGTIEKMKHACLKEGKLIGFLTDQHTTGNKSIRVNFFGVPAASIRGLAGLVRETGIPVVPICAPRRADGSLDILLMEELRYTEAPELPAGSSERILREEFLHTQACQDVIETMVRRHPDQWLWIHRRWKADRSPLSPTSYLDNIG